jgi:hypothetical protein
MKGGELVLGPSRQARVRAHRRPRGVRQSLRGPAHHRIPDVAAEAYRVRLGSRSEVVILVIRPGIGVDLAMLPGR